MDFSELIKAADPQVFVDSIKSWVANLSINSVIMFIMMIFMIVGAVDRIRGNKKATAKNSKRASMPWARLPSQWQAS